MYVYRINKCFRYIGVDRQNKLDDLISDIAFFIGNCYACQYCSSELVCPKNLTDILVKVQFRNIKLYYY